MLNTMVARMMSRDGHTSAGAKWKIWPTYSSDMSPLKPTDRLLFSIMLHRALTLLALVSSSPEENFRKKLTGRDNIRIMTDASTAWEVLVLIRSIRRERTSSMSWAAKALHKRNVAMPSIRLMLRLLRTVPVTRL